MKQFKFEITLMEHDLEGDEFWEQAIARDGTGIADLTEFLIQIISDSNLLYGSDKEPKDIIKFISYTDK